MMTSFEVVFDFATQTYPGLNWLPQGVITKINEKKGQPLVELPHFW
jgi:hypothetical protein